MTIASLSRKERERLRHKEEILAVAGGYYMGILQFLGSTAGFFLGYCKAIPAPDGGKFNTVLTVLGYVEMLGSAGFFIGLAIDIVIDSEMIPSTITSPLALKQTLISSFSNSKGTI